tara:strand:+ start:501 stop:662 length:162 start_codon:yes stop_codon:yes gene_type:complete
MKQVDARGHYESDDETGFFFKQIKDLQNLLNDLFEIEQTKNLTGEDTNAKKEK